MTVTATASASRQLAIYLGVDVPVDAPDGEYDLDSHAVWPSYGSGPGDRDPEDAEMAAARNNAMIDYARIPAKRAKKGSAIAIISAALEPRYVEPGQSIPDGRTGTPAAIEKIVLAWPRLPERRSIASYLDGVEYVEQGRNWDRLVVDGGAVYDAIAAGESAEDVKKAVRSGDERFGRRERATDPK